MTAFQSRPTGQASPPSSVAVSPTVTSTDQPSTTAAHPITTAETAIETQLLVVWTSGGLPAGLETRVAAIEGVSLVSVVRSDLVWLETEGSGGSVVPLEAIAVDDAFREIAPAEWQATLDGLNQGGVALGASSAKLRSATVGDVLSLAEEKVNVVGVIPDEVVGAAELVTNAEQGLAMGVLTPRYLLVTLIGTRASFERSVRAALPEGTAVRIRAPGETPFLRHGDAVLPQVIVKEQFGEFSLTLQASGQFQIDDNWVGENLATVTLPVIGEATCHIGILSSLRGALEELEQSNLSFLIQSFDGCYVPRFIGGTRSLSRHSWGVGIDLNYAANPTGQVTVQDPRLVSIMERWGFNWGGNWLVPDAAHFEWVSPPRR